MLFWVSDLRPWFSSETEPNCEANHSHWDLCLDGSRGRS